MRKNEVADVSEVFYLKNLKNLRILWLNENPCSMDDANYRTKVLAVLPQLQKLDDTDVSQDERAQAMASPFAKQMENLFVKLHGAAAASDFVQPQQQQQQPIVNSRSSNNNNNNNNSESSPVSAPPAYGGKQFDFAQQQPMPRKSKLARTPPRALSVETNNSRHAAKAQLLQQQQQQQQMEEMLMEQQQQQPPQYSSPVYNLPQQHMTPPKVQPPQQALSPVAAPNSNGKEKQARSKWNRDPFDLNPLQQAAANIKDDETYVYDANKQNGEIERLRASVAMIARQQQQMQEYLVAPRSPKAKKHENFNLAQPQPSTTNSPSATITNSSSSSNNNTNNSSLGSGSDIVNTSNKLTVNKSSLVQAVMSLLQELDKDALAQVKKEAEKLLLQ